MNILTYFIENPEKEFHVRELARKVKKSPATISNILKNLEKSQLLISRREYNRLLFRANSENKDFQDLKLAHNIKKVRSSGIIDYLINEFNHPEAIMLFGSFARSDNGKESDIDLLIISPVKKKLELEKYEKKLKHKTQIFIANNQEIEIMKTKNKELLNSWINGIALYGFWEVFK
jgi:predicted nucleotidyltransferase